MTTPPPGGDSWSREPAPPPPPPPPAGPLQAPPPYPPPYPPQVGAGPVYGTSTNGFAVAALVLGIVGPTMCVAWILALVFGYIAKSQIDKSGGRQTGRGMAVASIVLGWVWLGLLVVYLAIMIIVAAADSGT